MATYTKIFYLPQAEREVVWEAFLNEHAIESWTAHEAESDERVGYDFKMNVDGQRIIGRNTSIDGVQKDHIEQEWQLVDRWEKPAQLSMRLYEVNDTTRMDLIIRSIPRREDDEVRRVWADHIIPRLSHYVQGKLNQR